MEDLKKFIADAKGETLSFVLELVRLILVIFESKNFTDSEDQMKEDEKVFRQMTMSEKAMFSLRENLQAIRKQKIEEQKLLLEGENIVENNSFSSPTVCLGGMMCISMLFGFDIHKSYSPKDQNHPDWLKAVALDEEIDMFKYQIELLDTFLWESIKSDLPQDKCDNHYSLVTRSGFQIVLSNDGL